MIDCLNYKGKACVLTGAASGLGRATYDLLTELGANVYALDINEVKGAKNYIKIDLSDKKSIDNAMAQLPDKIDSIFSVAAVPGLQYRGRQFTLEQAFAINYAGPRYFIETLYPRIPKGGAVAMVSSIAGAGWVDNMELLEDLYTNAPTFEKALEWAQKNVDNPKAFDGCKGDLRLYCFTKETIAYYVRKAAFRFSKNGVRLNGLCPGGIDTPMTEDFELVLAKGAGEAVGGNKFGTTVQKAKIGHVEGANPYLNRQSTPEEQANCIVFLNSDMATFVSGTELCADYGNTSAFMLQQYDRYGGIFEE